MNSPFRPRKRPDPAILDDHRPLLRLLERRGLIRGGLSLGALTMLTGCDVTRPKSVEDALLAMSRLNDSVQAWLFAAHGDHQAYLRGGLGLHRRMDGRAAAHLP
jgi:hypothetical protein